MAKHRRTSKRVRGGEGEDASVKGGFKIGDLTTGVKGLFDKVKGVFVNKPAAGPAGPTHSVGGRRKRSTKKTLKRKYRKY